MKNLLNKLICVAAVATACTLHTASASAVTFSHYPNLSVELLSGWRSADEHGESHIAGIRIKMGDGWRTYWRIPGESGLPLKIFHEDSTNVSNIRILWPTPSIFDINDYRSFGYEKEIVLPILIQPNSPGESMSLNARLEFGVCNEICIPANWTVNANLPTHSVARNHMIEQSLKNLPTYINEYDNSGISSCEFKKHGSHFDVTVKMSVPRSPGEEVTVFEFPNKLFWFSRTQTQRLGGNNLVATAIMEYSGMGPIPIDRSQFQVTVISQNGAIVADGCAG